MPWLTALRKFSGSGLGTGTQVWNGGLPEVRRGSRGFGEALVGRVPRAEYW